MTPGSDFVDIAQHKADLTHPHAYLNQGYFKEEHRIGTFLDGEWDYPRIRFTETLEYKAMREFILKGRDWYSTEFSRREANFIKSGKKTKNFCDVEDYFAKREIQIRELISSIRLKGVKRVSRHFFSADFVNEISVNMASDGELLFNNRGHHRLSIAKILGIESIPVVIIVWHEQWVNNNGFTIKPYAA